MFTPFTAGGGDQQPLRSPTAATIWLGPGRVQAMVPSGVGRAAGERKCCGKHWWRPTDRTRLDPTLPIKELPVFPGGGLRQSVPFWRTTAGPGAVRRMVLAEAPVPSAPVLRRLRCPRSLAVKSSACTVTERDR